MSAISLIDWIFTAALVAASWQMYHAMQQHASRAAAEQAPRDSRPHRTATPMSEAGPLGDVLQRIRRTGGYRDLDEFMRGARLAYERIVAAFAMGQLEPVAPLLGPAIRTAFTQAIDERRSRGETLSTIFIGFMAAEPVDAGLDSGTAWIEVRFVAQMVSVTTDRDGAVVAGHPRHVAEVSEAWTFARETRSPDPNWVLVATDSDA